jgi:hypothetical protein
MLSNATPITLDIPADLARDAEEFGAPSMTHIS